MRRKVILDPHFRSLKQIFTDADLQRLRRSAAVVWGRDDPMPAELFEAEKTGAWAVICSHWRYGGLEGMPELRAILEVSGGLPSPRMLDYAECFRRGIRVLSCAPAFGPMVAEMALALALAAARSLAICDRSFRSREERYQFAGNAGSFTLYDQTVGFVGFGGLAENLRPLLAPFRARIQVYDPWLPESHLKRRGVVPVSLERLMATSRLIFVLALPTPENRGLLSRKLLGAIPKGSVLVLISRAHLVDFEALTEMVAEGRFRAGIDVYPEEPLLKNHPIRDCGGAVLTAHIAGSVEKDIKSIGRMAVDDLEAMMAGIPPREMQQAQPELAGRLR